MVTTRCETHVEREQDLRRFRFHTGAQPARLAPDEPCPPLFRDIGFEAMGRFLRGELTRLCGPLSPITYLRTAAYCEPYVDHGCIGRIMLLQPQQISPWHSGLEAVYIAPRETRIEPATMVFIPAEIPLSEAVHRFAAVRQRSELTDLIGPSVYESMIADTRDRLTDLQQTHQETERMALPLRRLFQSMDRRERERAAKWLERTGLNESDLCTAWHHLSRDRREHIRASLREIPEVHGC